MKAIKKLLVEFFHETSLHAIPNILRSNHVLVKLLWLISFFLSLGFCLAIFVEKLYDFFSYAVIANVNMVFEKKPAFPKITFCNIISSGFYIYSSLFAATEHNSNIVNINNDCVAFNPDYNAPKTVHEQGYRFGLRINFVLFNWDPLKRPTLYIDNQSISEIDPVKGIKLSTGLTTSIALSREYTSRLGEPYSQCQHHLSLKTRGQNETTSFPYHKKNCLRLCRYKEIALRCNRSAEFTNFASDYYVNIVSFLRSFETLKVNCPGYMAIETEVDRISYELCESQCLAECDSMVYLKNINYRKRSNFYQYEGGVDIYFNELIYKVTTQIEKTNRIDFFAIMSGLFSLFLGITLLTLVELIELGLSFIWIAIRS